MKIWFQNGDETTDAAGLAGSCLQRIPAAVIGYKNRLANRCDEMWMLDKP